MVHLRSVEAFNVTYWNPLWCWWVLLSILRINCCSLTWQSSLFNPNFCFYIKPSLQDTTSPGWSLKLNVWASISVTKRKREIEPRQYFGVLVIPICRPLFPHPESLRQLPNQKLTLETMQTERKCVWCFAWECVLFELYFTLLNKTQNHTV